MSKTSISHALARVVAHATGGEIVVFSSSHHGKSKLISSSISEKMLPDSVWVFKSEAASGKIIYIPNLARSKEFPKHPIINFLPFAKRILHVPIYCGSDKDSCGLTIVNATAAWPFSSSMIALLDEAIEALVGLHLADCARQEKGVSEAESSARPSAGLSEATVQSAALQPHEHYLYDTLPRRTRLRSRGDVSYVTLRQWGTKGKQAQLKALAIAKKEPSQAFVNSVANEMADHIMKVSGPASIQCVVPVPGGHSRSESAFSIKIGKAIAQRLSVPLVQVFRNQRRAGASHPRKNATLPQMSVKTTTKFRSVLLVDDVATTGTHAEACVTELRKMVDAVQTVVWIGPS